MADVVLPQQITLDIVYFCDIPTLKCLRLAHRSIYHLIDTYQISICSNVMDRLFEREEVDLFRLLDKSSPAILALFALDYRVRTAKRLAAIGMENFQEDQDLCHAGPYGNISSNEINGDPIRRYVTIGWSVLWRLADIAWQLVHSTSECNPSISESRLSSLTRGISSLQEIETTIKNRQLEYISTLPELGREIFGYYCLVFVIAQVFTDRIFDDRRGKVSEWRTGNEYERRSSWLNWLVLREGPGFFVRAWASKEGNQACERLISREWAGREKKQLLVEYTAAKEVEDRLLEAALKNSHRRYSDLMDWARSGREIERVFTDVTYHLGHRLPATVIRSIEEDYSDYSS